MTNRPYSTRAQTALGLADSTAERVGDPFIGQEHLLMGLLEDVNGPAAQVLNHLGVTAEAVRAVWTRTTGRAL
jgi:ATP-dependent Clp protease ATP-binding subunit ClpC